MRQSLLRAVEQVLAEMAARGRRCSRRDVLVESLRLLEEEGQQYTKLKAAREELDLGRATVRAGVPGSRESGVLPGLHDLIIATLRTAMDGFWVVDENGHFIDVNDAYCELIGYSRDELLGMSISDLESAESPQETAQHIARVRAEGRDRFLTRHRRKDGVILDVEVSTHYVPHGGGIFIVFVRDVSEGLEKERALRSSRDGLQREVFEREAEASLLRTAVEHLPGSVLVTDKGGRIEYVNPAFTRITGYLPEEALGKTPRLLKSGVQDAATYKALWGTILSGREWFGELVNRRKDGTQYVQELLVAPIRDRHGHPTHFVGIGHDVTERRDLERQMRAAQRMEAVGRLAGGIAHDFNNLLTVIQGYARFLHDDFREGDPAREDTDAILNAAERAARLTGQLLAFSRKQIQELRVVDLNETVAELDKLLRRLIGEDIDLVTKLSPDLGRAKVDVTQIEQVLMNLVVNARDAMSGGGKLTIETANAQLEETYGAAKNVEVPPGQYVMLAVTDTGTGMDKETQSQIFEPFFTTKEKGKGTGLGLSTVYGIVKQSGGYIWVYSELGQGTTFKMYLPRVGEEVKLAASLHRAVGELRGKETILLVEDDEPVRKVAARILRRHGYRVLQAGNGGDALLLCERHEGPIHLMLTDVVMPQMSGRELAKRLAAVRPDMRVIFSSGYTDNAVAHRGVFDEGTVFVQKPFSPNALLRKVRETLDKG